MRKSMVALVLLAGPLGGCVAGIAAGAVGAAVRSAERPKDPRIDVAPAAREACAARAAQVGAVRIIDIEPRGPGKVIVWGIAGEDAARRSFECRYDGRIAAFKLRAISEPTSR